MLPVMAVAPWVHRGNFVPKSLTPSAWRITTLIPEEIRKYFFDWMEEDRTHPTKKMDLQKDRSFGMRIRMEYADQAYGGNNNQGKKNVFEIYASEAKKENNVRTG